MHKVAWSPRALADLHRLEDFLFDKNPGAAARAVRAIGDATSALAMFPERGRPAKSGKRELAVRYSSSGYLVLYDIRDRTVRILQVRHQRERQY